MSIKKEFKNFASKLSFSVHVKANPKARLIAELEALNSDAADSFIETEIKAGRMVPAERANFKSLFVQSALDDFARPLASGSRLAMLKENQQKKESNGLTQELIQPDINEAFLLRLGDSQIAKMEKDADDQVSKYVVRMTAT